MNVKALLFLNNYTLDFKGLMYIMCDKIKNDMVIQFF